MTHLLVGLASVEIEVDKGGEQAGGDQQEQHLQQTILPYYDQSSQSMQKSWIVSKQHCRGVELMLMDVASKLKVQT